MTGHRVVGTEQGGIVFYRWHGQNYSLDTPGYRRTRSRRRRKRGGPRPAIDVLDTEVAARNLRELRGGPGHGQ